MTGTFLVLGRGRPGSNRSEDQDEPGKFCDSLKNGGREASSYIIGSGRDRIPGIM